jgi:OmcA/MtrC family decaheme c-type cytochrome
VVSVDSCNACHGVVSAHGENRNGSIDTCVVCHNPKATDVMRRGTGSAGAGLPESPVDFKVMIHQIHAADIKQNPVTIFGFGNTPHTFPGEVPHGVGNCNLCHSSQSWRLPLATEVLDTVVDTSGTPANQADDVTLGAMRAVCTSCHDNVRFAQAVAPAPALPACNTLAQVNGTEPEDFCFHSAGNVADTACAACHGTGQSDDVAQKHPIR